MVSGGTGELGVFVKTNKMSANNEIRIYKKEGKWMVKHWDIDCGELEKIGEYDNLEEAVKAANGFEEMCNQEGYGIEYGLNIIT